MRVADRILLHRAQAKTLRGVVGGLLQPAIVEHQRLGLAVLQEQLAIVSAGKGARDLMPHGIAVEVGAVEQGGRGVHEGSNAEVPVHRGGTGRFFAETTIMKIVMAAEKGRGYPPPAYRSQTSHGSLS